MTRFEEACIFALEKHQGQVRKIKHTPYILHPFEVANIIATLTTDEDVMIAGLLHDTVEDTDTEPGEIKEKFGSRVYKLVMSETEDKLANLDASATWETRKESSILFLQMTKELDVKRLWLSDKLSNMRSFYRTYLEEGDEMWNRFHMKNKSRHQWYYETILEAMPELSDTVAYKEYKELVWKIFHGKEV